MRTPSILRAISLAALAALACSAAFAQADPAGKTPVDVQLVLAVDASGSVTPRRFELQKQGYIAAFRDPKVLAAIQSGIHGAIAVTLFQWTGPRLQAEVIPWMIIKDDATGKAAADAMSKVPRMLFGGGTSLSGAIDHSMDLLSRGPFVGDRGVIDVSGDGSNNRGRPADRARDDALKQGVVINGLPILTIEPDLDDYYRDSVIGGEGSFVIAIKELDAFADAIVRKLVAEIASNDYSVGGRGTIRR